MTKDDLQLIPETFPGYTRQRSDFPERYYYVFQTESAKEDYNRMVGKLIAAVEERRFFPLMRICHGEFILCVGRWMPKGIIRRTKFLVKQMLMYIHVLPMIDYGGNLSNGTSREKVGKRDLLRIRKIWVESMRDLSRAGLIAPAFNDRFSYIENIDKMFRFFAANDIRLDAENAAPFFGVYAFLCGPDLRRLVNNRHVAAVTWLNENRQNGIERFLLEAGAKSVDFIGVSPHCAVFEAVDPATLLHSPEVVFFACGLGSASLIHQFRNTNAVCIDAGFALDLFANPELRGKRAWTLPDYLYDEYKNKPLQQND